MYGLSMPSSTTFFGSTIFFGMREGFDILVYILDINSALEGGFYALELGCGVGGSIGLFLQIEGLVWRWVGRKEGRYEGVA